MAKKIKKWIQSSRLKKGALSRQLGVPIAKNIPITVLNKVVKAKIGTRVLVPKGKVTVTRLMKRRAVMAKTLKLIK
jgi:hypothetical protein